MKIDQYGQVEITEAEAFEALYSKKINSLDGVYINDNAVIDQFNNSQSANADKIPKLKHLEIFDDSIEFFDSTNQCNWFMPNDYFPNLVEMLYGMCETDLQKDRVTQELELYIQHNMFDLLFYLKYLVDTMRENKVVWGVGRGSSVASYVLYLIGIHKVDSIKYELDIKEFLK